MAGAFHLLLDFLFILCTVASMPSIVSSFFFLYFFVHACMHVWCWESARVLCMLRRCFTTEFYHNLLFLLETKCESFAFSQDGAAGQDLFCHVKNLKSLAK